MATSTKRSRYNVQSPRNRLGDPQVLEAFLQATLAFLEAGKKDEVDSPDALQVTTQQLVAEEKTLSQRLWDQNSDLADAAWETQFIQGIAHGNLDPNDFGHYTVQDAAYCNAATDNLQFLTDKVEATHLEAFIKGPYESYKKYTDYLYETWFLKPDGADLGPAAQSYVDLENEIAHNEEALYYLVSMIPCLRLWAYLAIKMKNEGYNKDSNIYKFWIDDNGDNEYKSAEKVESVVNRYSDLGRIDEEKAKWFYRKCMYGEVNFFKSACDEPLLIIPPQ
ncbi:aminopyrimidine aminohydrolase-like [Branchiostoma floridae x Branchiostoma belcheri]